LHLSVGEIVREVLGEHSATVNRGIDSIDNYITEMRISDNRLPGAVQLCGHGTNSSVATGIGIRL